MGISKSKTISRALSLWFDQEHKKWSNDFFDFDKDYNFPDVKELRSDINDDLSDPLV